MGVTAMAVPCIPTAQMIVLEIFFSSLNAESVKCKLNSFAEI